ncbi:MAG: phospholipase [Rhodospirillaceae bacterium]|nr:MAG: phospholipase [Rhodospirillaceae bacterium]
MSVVDALHGPVQQPANGPATAAVVLLHGYGSDGNDLIGLAPYFANALPRAVFYAPDGPHALEGSPFGGRQWFSLRNFDPEVLRDDMKMRAKFFESMAGEIDGVAATLNTFLDQILAHHGLAANRLVLLGFSQGTMMSLHVGLRRKQQLGGIVGYSGELLVPERLAAEIKSKPPVVLIHGADDPMIPAVKSQDSAAALTAIGVSCQTHIIPGLQHGIDGTGAQFGAEFMQRVIG